MLRRSFYARLYWSRPLFVVLASILARLIFEIIPAPFTEWSLGVDHGKGVVSIWLSGAIWCGVFLGMWALHRKVFRGSAYLSSNEPYAFFTALAVVTLGFVITLGASSIFLYVLMAALFIFFLTPVMGTLIEPRLFRIFKIVD